MRKRREWSKIDPVEYLHKHYSHVKTRSQLEKEDSGLHGVLARRDELNKIFPRKKEYRDWKKKDPVEYFHKHCSHVKTVTQLIREDHGLYLMLRRTGKLDKLFPEKQTHRDWSELDPVEYFHENYLHIKNRKQLSEEDQSLYQVLVKIGKVDEVLPTKKQLEKKALEIAIERYAG